MTAKTVLIRDRKSGGIARIHGETAALSVCRSCYRPHPAPARRTGGCAAA